MTTIVEGFFYEQFSARLLDAALAATIHSGLLSTPEGQQLEKVYPGIGDAMVAGATREMAKALPERFASARMAARAHWTQFSDADLTAFAAVLRPSVADMATLPAEVRVGETATMAMQRTFRTGHGAEIQSRLSKRLSEFSTTPAGRRIGGRLDGFLREVGNAKAAATTDLTKRALAAADRAANNYVIASGEKSWLPFPSAGIDK
ncbi:hypothetical protein CVN68_14340 [Sphingomonas psychrotolerans]|uniref:Uncharacterized protein n=1 Tax=Sphingomonas psychrotolerans TaxID=1327635 RepID=A0A2K8MKB4_9SPHN|nr:hypothetical protein CVN68_14340 [Sphingomonas psychrotolerans]